MGRGGGRARVKLKWMMGMQRQPAANSSIQSQQTNGAPSIQRKRRGRRSTRIR